MLLTSSSALTNPSIRLVDGGCTVLGVGLRLERWLAADPVWIVVILLGEVEGRVVMVGIEHAIAPPWLPQRDAPQFLRIWQKDNRWKSNWFLFLSRKEEWLDFVHTTAQLLNDRSSLSAFFLY